MQEIDGMDMLGFLTIRSWDAQHELRDRHMKPAYIDEVWSTIKP